MEPLPIIQLDEIHCPELEKDFARKRKDYDLAYGVFLGIVIGGGLTWMYFHQIISLLQ